MKNTKYNLNIKKSTKKIQNFRKISKDEVLEMSKKTKSDKVENFLE